jgi:hypothetical protein
MSLERMFEDLESRMDHLESEERRAVAEDLTRAERAQIAVVDRLRAADGGRIGLRLRDGTRIEGELAGIGADWLRLQDGAESRSIWVPLAAVVLLDSLPEKVRELGESRLRPPGLGHELRGLARDRVLVRISTEAGEVRGRIAAVGQDAVDVRLLPTGEQCADSGRRVTVLLAAILLLTAERRG